MAFENISDQLKEQLQELKSRITESESFNRLSEWYNNLPSKQQKLLLILTGVVVFLLLINIPIQSFLTSQEELSTYKEQKQVIQRLHIAEQLKSQSDFNPERYSDSRLNGELSGKFKSLQINNDQYSISPTSPHTLGIPKQAQIIGYDVHFENLNVRQLAKVSNIIENLSDSILVTALEAKASRDNPHYFNTDIQVLNYSIEGSSNSNTNSSSLPFKNRGGYDSGGD